MSRAQMMSSFRVHYTFRTLPYPPVNKQQCEDDSKIWAVMVEWNIKGLVRLRGGVSFAPCCTRACSIHPCLSLP